MHHQCYGVTCITSVSTACVTQESLFGWLSFYAKLISLRRSYPHEREVTHAVGTLVLTSPSGEVIKQWLFKARRPLSLSHSVFVVLDDVYVDRFYIVLLSNLEQTQ